MPTVGLGISFGHRGQLLGKLPVGETNEALAALIAKDRDEISFLVVQHEIATSLWLKHHIPADFQVAFHREPQAYLNTPEVIRQSLRAIVLERLDPKKVQLRIYCHESAVSGVRSILRQFDLTADYVTTPVFDPLSAQWWTRDKFSLFLYKVREGWNYWRRGEVTLIDLIKSFYTDVILRKPR